MVEKIRGLRLLQSARGDVCGHFVSHGLFEDASQRAEFLAAMCSAGGGGFITWVRVGDVEEANALGAIAVRLPSVNHSRMGVHGGGRVKMEKRALRVGFDASAGTGAWKPITAILRVRGEGPARFSLIGGFFYIE